MSFIQRGLNWKTSNDEFQDEFWRVVKMLLIGSNDEFQDLWRVVKMLLIRPMGMHLLSLDSH